MQWGDKVRAVQSQIRPDMLEEFVGPRPYVSMGSQFFLDAFNRLHSERQIVAGAVCGIPVTKVREYCDWAEFEDTDLFINILQELDSFYVEMLRGRLKEQIA